MCGILFGVYFHAIRVSADVYPKGLPLEDSQGMGAQADAIRVPPLGQPEGLTLTVSPRHTESPDPLHCEW
jgi:hypothetical protein